MPAGESPGVLLVSLMGAVAGGGTPVRNPTPATLPQGRPRPCLKFRICEALCNEMRGAKTFTRVFLDSKGGAVSDQAVPASLRKWFVVHFAVDVVVAVPLFIAPRALLGLFGWSEIDPTMSRGVAAALFGIGIQSLLGRNADRSVFRAMLALKIVWSTFAMLGIVASLFQGAPRFAWVFLGVFATFSALWWRYWLLLRRAPDRVELRQET